jgi:hypothetical protein
MAFQYKSKPKKRVEVKPAKPLLSSDSTNNIGETHSNNDSEEVQENSTQK